MKIGGSISITSKLVSAGIAFGVYSLLTDMHSVSQQLATVLIGVPSFLGSYADGTLQVYQISSTVVNKMEHRKLL